MRTHTKKLLSILLVLSLMFTLAACGGKEAAPAADANGVQVFEGVGQGKHGDIKVQVSLLDNKITDIKVTEHKENEVLAEPVYTQLKQDVMTTNSAKVDAISGSTATSKGYLEAIQDAITKSGLTLVAGAAVSGSKDKEEAEQTYDVVVIGAGVLALVRLSKRTALELM